MSSKRTLNILMIGAGAASPPAAYFLAKAGHSVTIVERATALRDGGQNVDIRNVGLEVMEAMGLLDTIKQRTTREKGLQFVDSNNNIRAAFPVDEGDMFTAEVEILRGELVDILYDHTKDFVEYRFSTIVTSLDFERDEKKVYAKLENDGITKEECYDLVVGADGVLSQTRSLMFGEDASRESIKKIRNGQFVAYFSIPRAETDKGWARWYNSEGSKVILTRPYKDDLTGVFMGMMALDTLGEDFERGDDLEEQKKTFHHHFKNAGWEAPRVLDGMEKATDMYTSRLAQIKLPKWSAKGRSALIGDAAYCPTLLTGMGTTLAFLGAYTLAGEVSSTPDDLPGALDRFETAIRPFVEKIQALPPGTPDIANPKTSWGIKVFHTILGFAAWSNIMRLSGYFGTRTSFKLPKYEIFEQYQG